MSMRDSDDPTFLSEGETRLTRLTCPECGGSLAQADLPRISYFRCHVGHQYSPQSLEAAQAEAVEAKLWAAVAALEEHAALARHLAEHHQGVFPGDAGSGYGSSAARSAATADVVRARIPPPASPQEGGPVPA